MWRSHQLEEKVGGAAMLRPQKGRNRGPPVFCRRAWAGAELCGSVLHSGRAAWLAGRHRTQGARPSSCAPPLPARWAAGLGALWQQHPRVCAAEGEVRWRSKGMDMPRGAVQRSGAAMPCRAVGAWWARRGSSGSCSNSGELELRCWAAASTAGCIGVPHDALHPLRWLSSRPVIGRRRICRAALKSQTSRPIKQAATLCDQ